jgi:hypothetical protein
MLLPTASSSKRPKSKRTSNRGVNTISTAFRSRLHSRELREAKWRSIDGRHRERRPSDHSVAAQAAAVESDDVRAAAPDVQHHLSIRFRLLQRLEDECARGEGPEDGGAEVAHAGESGGADEVDDIVYASWRPVQLAERHLHKQHSDAIVCNLRIWCV